MEATGMDMVKMGSFLAELRKEHHLTQAELGEKLGVTNKTISRWETGNYMPPVEMLEELSNMYNMTILHNRMMAYVENCIYCGTWDEYKKREK